jgi:hypothetical protein
VIVLPHERGHAVIEQAEHARQCGELARAWAQPQAPDVVLAAEEHELGMVEWDRAPELDDSSGLPRTVTRMRLEAHLPLRLDGPRRLAQRSPYAALLASLHHVSFYTKPPVHGLLRRPGRLIAAYLRESAAFQEELRAQVDASEEQVDRDWRLVRRWDGISHMLLHDRPADLEPWPFRKDTVEVPITARLLERTFEDREALHAALAAAPAIELPYVIERSSTARRSSESDSLSG